MAVFLDTDVLIYSISTAGDQAEKREKALVLLDRTDCVLSVQVLQEFYVQATRPSRDGALSHHTAAGIIEAFGRFRVQDNTVDVLELTLDIREKTGFSFWDCSIIAAAQIAACETLYSEDLTEGHQINGVMVVNPFG